MLSGVHLSVPVPSIDVDFAPNFIPYREAGNIVDWVADEFTSEGLRESAFFSIIDENARISRLAAPSRVAKRFG
jgi:hypothetical protein